jgi:hypothetical protein
MKITAYSGDKIEIKVVNKKNPQEYSVYRVTIDNDSYKGDGIDDVFLSETTGYEED